MQIRKTEEEELANNKQTKLQKKLANNIHSLAHQFLNHHFHQKKKKK